MRLRFWTADRLSEAKEARLGVASDAACARLLTTRWGIPISRSSVQNALRAARGAEGKKALPTPVASQGSWDGVERRKSSPAERWLYRNVSAQSMNASAAPEPAEAPPSETPAPAPWVRKTYDHHLVIPDPQIPFHHPKARAFIEQVRREWSVPKDNMLCAGDEADQFYGSRFDHSPDADHTPNSEIEALREELKHWYGLWPVMKLATSNHGVRWVKKALGAQIPSQLLRAYRDVLQAPDGWQWADSWRIDAKHPFMLEHGHNGPQGWGGLRNRALQNGISTVFGHQHANAGIAHVVTAGQRVWSMCVGSLIDTAQYAFEYDRGNTFKPWVGVGIVIGSGSTPILVPYSG